MRLNDPVTQSQSAPTGPSSGRSRWKVTGIVVLAALVVAGLYALVVTTYSASLSGTMPKPEPPTGGVAIIFSVENIDPGEQRVTGTLEIVPSVDLTNSDGTLNSSIAILVSPSISKSTLVFTVGEIPAPQEIVLPASGTVQEYPLDKYTLDTFLTPFILDSGPEPTDLPLVIETYVDLAGWVGVEPADPMPLAGSPADGQLSDWIGKDLIDATLQRSPSTMMLSALLLLLLLSLVTVAILVTVYIARGRLRAEFGPASWLTAMLFAVLPVRGFFPGSPPIGSWIDILVVFWVILLIMLCVAAVAAMLLRRAREASRGTKTAVAEKPTPAVDDAVG